MKKEEQNKKKKRKVLLSLLMILFIQISTAPVYLYFNSISYAHL